MSTAMTVTKLARALWTPHPDVAVNALVLDHVDSEGQAWIVAEVFTSYDWSGQPPIDRRIARRSAQVRLSDPTGRLVRQASGDQVAPRDLDVMRAFNELAVALHTELQAIEQPRGAA
jgi:hypothetical protein